MIQFNYSIYHDPEQDAPQPLKQKEKLLETLHSPQVGFFNLCENQDTINQVLALTNYFQTKKHFVQVGIGGSALGPQMLISALRPHKDKTFRLLDNIDADYISDQLHDLDIKESIFYIVSKSGGTAETIASYIIVQNLLLEKGISHDELKDYFVFCTDPNLGELREYVEKQNYHCLEIPSNTGGRYSVLTPVGLFPAAFMGIQIQKLYAGASAQRKEILDQDEMESHLFLCAHHIVKLYHHSPSINQTVLMPYSSKLRDFSSWFVQLWAESLGKKENHGEQKPVGLTPISAYGATDQHSQMQLFMQGPNNKLIFLIQVKKRAQTYSLHSQLPLKSAHKLMDFSLCELMEAELKGSLAALKENKRNVIHLEIPQLDEISLGALILFYETLTVLVAQMLKVDPFNQPGVEKGKKYAFEYLNSLRK